MPLWFVSTPIHEHSPLLQQVTAIDFQPIHSKLFTTGIVGKGAAAADAVAHVSGEAFSGFSGRALDAAGASAVESLLGGRSDCMRLWLMVSR